MALPAPQELPLAPAPAPTAAFDSAADSARVAPVVGAAPAAQAQDAEPAPGASAAAVAPAPDASPQATHARLALRFPALLAAPGAPGPVKPIKLRVHVDIQSRAPDEFSRRALGLFFSRYTTTSAYLRALVKAPHRFDLDGQPAGDIADEHRQAAHEELARREAVAAARRGAQRPVRATSRGDADGGDQLSATQGGPHAEGDAQRAEGRDHPRRRQPGQHARTARERADSHAVARTRAGQPDPARRRAPERAPPHDAVRAREPNHGAARAKAASVPRDAAPLPTDPARRERALLLRAYESSTLSKANFCALKRMSETELDALLAQARAERSGV
jgi:sRNA-binding protein